ncbi:MAG TPA: FAD-dependent oxidoreductase [Burkholderiaceae bacterium]|nr:FAD-dependent oxidoreductase [Burkholderiaceae bacterium]
MALVNKVLIVGGGIGGMCAAIQLRKQGIAVDLVEINPQWTVYGAGITISGPTLRALRTVGVADRVVRRGGHWSAIDICSADGTVMNTVPMAHAAGAEDLPGAAGIMRPVLAEILSDATREAGTQVRLGVTFESLGQDEHGVDVRFTDGSTARYDLVIGADGVNSKVREAVFAGAPVPRFSGQGSWRAVVPRTRRNSTIFMGKTTKAGLNPVSEHESYLFVLDHRENFDFIPAEQWPALLAELLQEFGGPIGEIRDGLLNNKAPDHRIVYRPLMGLMMAAPWHRGRVVLLGDAVHATTPHLASGAGIAVEGAVVLAEELARCHFLEGALAAYAGRRYDRARLVVDSSLRMGEIEQAHGSRDEHTRVMMNAMSALTAPI